MNSASFPDFSRRQFLTTISAAGVTLGLGLPQQAQAAGDRKVSLGLQLYSLREECKTDLPGMLKAVSKIGYKGVEFAGYHGRDAKELRKMLDDNGLVACGTHAPYETVIGDKLKETVEFNRAMGNKFLIVPWMTPASPQEWLDKAKLFNEASQKVHSDGMFVGYHAHAHDFKKVGEVSGWDLFSGHTNPEVILQMDIGNCKDGGADPVAVMKKYPGRTRTIHMKANGAGPEAVIGEDKIDWKEVFAFCEGPGKTDWYVIEHETSKDPLDAVRRSFEAMKKLGKV